MLFLITLNSRCWSPIVFYFLFYCSDLNKPVADSTYLFFFILLALASVLVYLEDYQIGNIGILMVLISFLFAYRGKREEKWLCERQW